ncbi:MAG: hypothetical protein ACO3F3_01020 [Gemmataceae bacterium]
MFRIPIAMAIPALVLVLPVWADLPSVRLDRIFPLGAAQGAKLEIEFQGADVDDPRDLVFDHPGIKSKFLKDRKFEVAVDPKVPPGTYDCWLVARYGVSNPRSFAVSSGFTDVQEKEPNDDLTQAQTVEVNSTIHGTSDTSKEDNFRFKLKKGQRVTIACNAERLDSQMDGVLFLHDGQGRQVASNGDYDGRDPFLDFISPQDSEYVAKLHDLSFRGGQPYRLVISDKPQLENISPRVVQGDTAAEIIAFGRNLGAKSKASNWSVMDLPLNEFACKVQPPKDILKLGRYLFLEHPSSHSVLPTAATCTLNGFQDLVIVDGASLITTPIMVSANPVTLEAEPNNSFSQAQKIQLPAVVSGRFDAERDGDWYEFEAKETGAYSLEVYCERIAGRADPYVFVQDDKGAKVGELDDYGHRLNGFDGHLRDPSGQVNLTAGKKYHLFVQDRYKRGGARFQYVLAIQKLEFDFHIASNHSLNPGPNGLNLRRGGTAWLNLIIHQKGPSVPITVRAEGLPAGVHAEPMIQRNSSNGLIVFHADKDAQECTVPIRLVASATRENEIVEREVRPYSRVWSEPNIASSRPMRQQLLAVRETAPFALAFEKSSAETKAGEKLELNVKLDRLWPEFKNQLTLQALEFPNSIKMANVILAADKNEAKVTLDVQANCQPGDYSVVISGQGQVPFSKDEKTTPKPNTLVTQASKPLKLTVKPKEEKTK